MTSSRPIQPDSKSLAIATHIGASASSPASPAIQRVPRLGARTIHRKATAHQRTVTTMIWRKPSGVLA